MNTLINIKTFGRLMLIALVSVFLLSACGEDAEFQKNSAYNTETANGTAADAAEEASQKDTAKVDCWQGKVLDDIYNVIGSLIMVQYANITKGSLAIISIGFAIWLALRLLKFVSSVTEASPSEIWNEIVRKAFICLFCGYLASNATLSIVFINTFIVPLYTAFLEFGGRILSLTAKEVSSVTVFGEEIKFVMENVSCQFPVEKKVEFSNGFPPEFRDTMSCMICSLVDKLRMGRKMALLAMSMGKVLPWITGLLVWAIFYVVGFGFVFYLVDSIFRLGMMILMLPLFIMSYAFGPTKKWANIGFVNIMYSAAFMMAFSIIVATTILSMITLVQSNASTYNPEVAQKEFSDIGVVSLSLMLIGFLVLGSLEVSQTLTKTIIGGHINAKFQQDLKAVAQMIKNIFVGGGKWALNKSGFHDTWVGRRLKAVGEVKDRLNELAGRPPS
ncbi:MAG: hypothetical protein E7012_01865 [Alphaproteobacteria bacterium]|nr:hypothetical protein [Alphaproteobacteria bacterium]